MTHREDAKTAKKKEIFAPLAIFAVKKSYGRPV
jgi:hypothetical protein